MGSVNLCVLHKKVAQLYSGQLEEWVCASVGSIYSTGGSYTYRGCSKAVYGATSSQSWLCRKKVTMYDSFPEECLNHGYRHEGKCCSVEEGILCYRFSLRLVDQSGDLEALIWAPAIHLLSVPPEEFEAMPPTQKEEVFRGLRGREWRFNILTVVDELGFRQFKVQFLLPTDRTYIVRPPKSFGEMMDMAMPRTVSLTLPPSYRSYPRPSTSPDQGRLILGSSKTSSPIEHHKKNAIENEAPSPEANPDQGRLVLRSSKTSSPPEHHKKNDIEDEASSPVAKRESTSQVVERHIPSLALEHLRTSLESLVAASQQNTRAIEHLALAVTEIQNESK